MHVAEGVEQVGPKLVSRRYSDYEKPPSTEYLAKLIMADPVGTLPLWEETDGFLSAQDWPSYRLKHPESVMAMRSENYALLGVVLSSFSTDLEGYRVAHSPLGLQQSVRGSRERVPITQEQARPDLDWVATAMSNSLFSYVGDSLEKGRQGQTPYTAAFARLAVLEDHVALRRSEQHALPSGDSSIDAERDESQVHINAGLSTATKVNKNLLMHIEELLRGAVSEVDAALIAETAHNSYGLPLALARLSIGSSLSFTKLLETNKLLTLSQSKGAFRVRFTAPPESLIEQISGFPGRDSYTLGCPANIKIGNRLTAVLWDWTIDVAEQVGVWSS